MKWIIFFILLGINTFPQSFMTPIPVDDNDKVMHLTVSYALTHCSYQYFKTRVPKKQARLYSILIPIGIGISKEIIDYKCGGSVESGDLLADGLGISFAILVIDF